MAYATRSAVVSVTSRCDRGLEASKPVARLIAEHRGWDEDTIAREVELYCERVEAERRSRSGRTTAPPTSLG